MIIELVSWQRRIDAFIRTMKPFGVIEVAARAPLLCPAYLSPESVGKMTTMCQVGPRCFCTTS